MMFITETGSTYFVNEEARTVCRIEGKGSATDRLKTGLPYLRISAPVVGRRVVIVWTDDMPLLAGSPPGAVPITETSRVIEVVS